MTIICKLLSNVLEIEYMNMLKLLDKKDILKLIETCKEIKHLFYINGFLENIVWDGGNYINFRKNYYIHKKMLKKVIFDRVEDPGDWIMNSNAELELKFCSFKNIKPHSALKNIKTLKLTYCDYGYNKREIPIIELSKFPNLENLHIEGKPVVLKNIEFCKNLQMFTYYSYTYNNYVVPNEIFKLPSLKHLAVTCKVESEIPGKLKTFIGLSRYTIDKECGKNLTFFDNGCCSWVKTDNDTNKEELKKVKLQMRSYRITNL